MDDKTENDSADNGQGKYSPPVNKQGKVPPDRETLLNVGEIVGSLIFTVCAFDFADAGFHILGFFFSFLALLCGIFIIYHHIKKAAFKFATPLFWLLNFLNLLLFLFLSWHSLAGPVTPELSHPSKIAVEPLAFRQKREGIYVLMGKTSIGLPPVSAGGHGVKDIGRAFLGAGTYEHPSQIGLVADENQIVLNIKYAPIFGMPPLELTNNELGGLPSDWDCNHRSNAVEVVNDKLVPVLQVYYKDDTHLVLNGAITFTNGLVKGVVLSAGEGFEIIHTPTLGNDELSQRIAALKLKRLFKYPAWKYPGQFDERAPSPDEFKSLPKDITNITPNVSVERNATMAADTSNTTPIVQSANSGITISDSTNVNITTVSNINVGPGAVGINQGTINQGAHGK